MFAKELMFVHKMLDFSKRIFPGRYCNSPPGVRVRVSSSPHLRATGTDAVVRHCSQHWRGGQRIRQYNLIDWLLDEHAAS